MSIEATKMPGTGRLILTGQLGTVMKESAQAALSFARAYANAKGVKEAFNKDDIHVHVPSGAVKKDGPSAGITITTALVSLLLKKAIRKEVAMTGEVTLRGKVLEIGGLKEKLLAAKRSGIQHVIFPIKKIPRVREIVYLSKQLFFPKPTYSSKRRRLRVRRTNCLFMSLILHKNKTSVN